MAIKKSNEQYQKLEKILHTTFKDIINLLYQFKAEIIEIIEKNDDKKK